MCIALLTTAHPSYALILLDNRDEFIQRPTSNPHWWSPDSSSEPYILSSRDLERKEQGTWLGITRNGKFAVLTNYREEVTTDPDHPINGVRSRGMIVTSWLAGPKEETTEEFARRMASDPATKQVGGFSLICGKVERRSSSAGNEGESTRAIAPLAVISNRTESEDDVPWICGEADAVHGLSNACYTENSTWEKVNLGKKLLLGAVSETVAQGADEDALMAKLFSVLDTDTAPWGEGAFFEEQIGQLQNTIFVPLLGQQCGETPLEVEATRRPESTGNPEGKYGTQRQTLILVDWEGKVTYCERSLYDEHGVPIPRGSGDAIFKFNLEGWQE